jgi:hypothetical protein
MVGSTLAQAIAVSVAQSISFSDVRVDDGEVRAVVHVPGETDTDLWFRVVGATPVAAPEAFVALALPVAMARGLSVESPGPLSKAFVDGATTWQSVFATWYPDRLEPVAIAARERRPKRKSKGVGCFFTGGVDSFFTALRHLHRIDRLVFVYGFDVPLEQLPDLRRAVTTGVRAAAEELERPLVEVETNLHDFSDTMGSPWGTTYHGAALAAVAHLLVADLGEVLVGATHTYADLFPWGSHPVADPLLSGDRLQLVHDGADADRVEKTIAVASSPVVRRHLRVCWENRDGTYNCGRCRKCIRTQIALRIAGQLDAVQTLDADMDLDAVRAMPLGDVNTVARHAELIRHLRRIGTEPELLAACEQDVAGHDPAATRWGTSDWTALLPLLFEPPGSPASGS